MWPDWVSNPGPLTYESGALPTAICGPAFKFESVYIITCTCIRLILAREFLHL